MQVTLEHYDGSKENVIVVDWDRSKYIGCIFEDGSYNSIRTHRTSMKITNRAYKLPHYFPYHKQLSNKLAASEIKQLRKRNKTYYTITTKSDYIKANSLKNAFSILRSLGKERYTLSACQYSSAHSITSPIFQTVPYQYYGIWEVDVSENTVLREIRKLPIEF